MKILLLITALAIQATARAEIHPPVIWGPNSTSAYFLPGQVSMAFGSADPSVVATYGNKGSLYVRTGSSGGTTYQKQDSGTTTNWTAFGVSGSGITALTGDVTASGNGSVPATVQLVGGSSASNVHSAEIAANAATSVNTPSTIVMRDSSGSFNAATITPNAVGINKASPPGALWVHSTADTLQGGVVLEGFGGSSNRIWDLYVDGSNGTLSVYNPNQNATLFSGTAAGLMSIGNQAARFRADINAGDAITDFTTVSGSSNGPYLGLRNTSNTNNNGTGFVFQNSSLAGVAGIFGINEDQTASPSGHVSVFTSNGGTWSEALRILKDQTVRFFAHLKSTGTAPSATPTANAGTGATCAVVHATDTAGQINLTTTAVSPGSGDQCDVTFHASYAVAPICTISPINPNAINLSVTQGEYISTSVSALSINFATVDAVGHAYQWNYHCVETQ